MAQSTPINSYYSRASFGCAYMHHIEKYVFQQKFCAPGLGLFLRNDDAEEFGVQGVRRSCATVQIL